MDNQHENGSQRMIPDAIQLEIERDRFQNQAARLRTRNAHLVELVRDLESVLARVTRLLFTADGLLLPLIEPTDAWLGAGHVLAPIWKNEASTGATFYEFGLFRKTAFGDAIARFRPEAVLELPKLVQQLAAYFAQVESLSPEIRDDLSCLACCLDDFLGQSRCPHRLNDPERAALAAVIEYLWEDEERSFLEDPTERHIFCSLKVLKQWFHSVSEAGAQ